MTVACQNFLVCRDILDSLEDCNGGSSLLVVLDVFVRSHFRDKPEVDVEVSLTACVVAELTESMLAAD